MHVLVGMQGWALVLAMLAAPAATHRGEIAGQVRHQETGEPIAKALVVLQCACLQSNREALTNAEGLYAFKGLPAGTYTVQVLVGQADVSKVLVLPPSDPAP